MHKLQNKIKVGITMGDPSGIGPAITLKAINELRGLADFLVIGDKWVFEKIQNSLRIQQTRNFKSQDYRLLDLNNVPHKNFEFGKIRAEYGRASIEYLAKAVELIENKEVDCLVTSPISKEAINLAGFNYAGHTEYLAARTKTKDFVMMLLNKRIRVSLVTRHIPLREVPSQLSIDKIYKTIFLTYRYLGLLFGIKNPRIAVCGLNPHASDNGLIGSEENRVIKPAIKKIKVGLKVRIDGPMPADVAMYKAEKKEYDCVIAMYHDQALIPLKLRADFTGVNMTLGLPFVRTSPLHGTAFDVAKKHSLANPASLIEAIRLALQCTLNLKKA